MKLIHWVENQLGGRRSKSTSCSTRRPSGEKEAICDEGRRKRSDSTATSSSFFFSPSSTQTAHYNHGGSIHGQEQIESTTTSKNMNVICGQRRARSESRTGEKILSFVRMDHSSFSTPRKEEERKGEERKGENEKEESTTKRGRKRSNKKSKEEKEERLTLQELRELLEQSYQQELKEREERMLQRSPALVQRSQQQPGHASSTLCHESNSNNKFQSSFNSNLSSGGTFTRNQEERDQEERERWIKNTSSLLGNTSLNQKKSSTLISVSQEKSSGEKSSSRSFRRFPGSALFSSFRRQNSNIETGSLNGNTASKNSVFMSQRVTQHVPHNTPSTLHPYCLGAGKNKISSSNFSSSSSSSSASPFLPSFSSSSPFDPKCTMGTTTGHDGSLLINFPSLTPAQEEEFLTILFPSSSDAVEAIRQSKSTVVAKEKEILRAKEKEIWRAKEKELSRAKEKELSRAEEQVVIGGSVKQRREEGNKSSKHAGSSNPTRAVNEKNSRTAVNDVMTNQSSSGGSNYGTSSREDFGGKERGERSRIKTNPWITSPFLSATHRQITKDHQHVTGRQLINDRQLICNRQSNIQSKTSSSNSSSSFGSTSSTDSGCAIFVPTNSSNAIHDVADHIYSNIMSPSSSSSSGHQPVILRNPRPVKECNLSQNTKTGPYIIGQSLTDQSLSEQFTNSVISGISNRISCGSFTSTSGCCSSGISCDNVNNNSNGMLIDEVDQSKVDGPIKPEVKMGTFTKRKSEIRKRIEKRRESLPPTDDEEDDEPSDSGRNSRRRSGTFTPKKSKLRHGTPNRRSSKLSANDSLLSRSQKKNSLRNDNGPSSPPPTPPPEASVCESLLHEVLSSIIPSRNGIYSREDISSFSGQSSPSSSEDILLGSNDKSSASKDSSSQRSSVFSCRSSSLSSDSEMIWTSNHSLYIHGHFPPPPPTGIDDFQKRFEENLPKSSHKFHGIDTLTLDEKRASFWSASSGSQFSSLDHDSLINNSLMDNESKRNSISSTNSRSSLSSTSTLTNGSTLTNASISNYICRRSRFSRNPFLKYFVGKRRSGGGNSINEEWISTATELFDSDHESTSLDQINLNQRINSNQVPNNRIKDDPNLCYEDEINFNDDEINCNDDEMDLKSSLTRASPFRISGHSSIGGHIDWRKNPFAKVRDSEKERNLRSDFKASMDKSDFKASMDNDHNNSSLQPSSSQFQDRKHQSKGSSNGNCVVLRRGKRRQGMVEEQFNELLMNPSFLDWSVNSRTQEDSGKNEEDSGKNEEDSGKREEEDGQSPSQDEDVPCPAPIDEILSRFSQQIRSSLIDPIENDCWDERQKEMEENLEGKKKKEENHEKEEERSKMSSFHFEITTKCHENGHFTRDLIHEKEKSSFLPSLLPTSVLNPSQLPSSERQDVRNGSGGETPLLDHSDSGVTENGHWKENSSPISGRNIYPVKIDTRIIDTRIVDTRIVDTRIVDTRIRGESQSLQHEVNDELSSNCNRFSEFSFTRNEEEIFGKNEEENSCHTSVISPGTVDSDSGLGVLLTCSDPATTLLTPSSFATTISPTDSTPTETSATNNILLTDPFTSSPSDDNSCNAFSLIDPIASASSDFSFTQRKGNGMEEKHEMRKKHEMKKKHESIPSNGMKIERRMEEDSNPLKSGNEDEKNDLPSKLGKLRLELKDVVDVAINEVREEETRKREERILIKRKLVEEKRKILMDKLSQLKQQFNRD